MLGMERLHDGRARPVPTAGASRHLGQELERAFCRPEIGHLQPDVGRHDTDERHIREVVTLGDHLCSHQHIYLARPETRQ